MSVTWHIWISSWQNKKTERITELIQAESEETYCPSDCCKI